MPRSCRPPQSPDVIVPNAPDATGLRMLTDAELAALHAPAGAVGAQASNDVALVITSNPFSVTLHAHGSERVVMNGQQLLYFEHRRHREGDVVVPDGRDSVPEADAGRRILTWGEDGKPVYADEDQGTTPDATDAEGVASASTARGLGEQEGGDAWWEESFGGHTDSKPHGPTSVGADTAFPGAAAVYGIPEHATDFALKPTRVEAGGYAEPYRLYNLDVFEYDLDVPMALYGSIPFMVAHSPERGTSGVFWNNPSETFVDVAHSNADGSSTWTARWMSESGVVDAWLMPGPSAADVAAQYAAATGMPDLPPRFALGYHQCRWNYKDEADVAAVDAGFESNDLPYDVLWLDIEHTDGKRYFTWDKALFPSPEAMQDRLAKRGRKMVTIVDPHIKRASGYDVHEAASANSYYVKNAKGDDFSGWCWPGSSSYLDFTDAKVRSWWADRFDTANYHGSTEHLYTWNDMNEPSVFDGPEVSMPKDAKSLAGVEHREWHNLYGYYLHQATAEGHRRHRHNGHGRSFVLSRAFYAGSQRHGAIWTGDNFARWDHLRASVPMLLSISVAGLPFGGADVGGFFEHPDEELYTRWYQAGAYQPFFRGHAHIDTPRREPWLFGEQAVQRVRVALRTRYALLPYWYTAFAQSALEGLPVMRPLWWEWPADSALLQEQAAWMVGNALLVAPALHAGAAEVPVPLPGHTAWFWADTGARVAAGDGATQTLAVPVDMDTVPVFQRGGTVVPRKMRARRATDLMANDPYTLFVALAPNGTAHGALFMDDGTTDAWQRGEYRLRALAWTPETPGVQSVFTSKLAGGSKSYSSDEMVERVVVYGCDAAPSSVQATTHAGETHSVSFVHNADAGVLILRAPKLKAAYDWAIQVQWQ